MPGDLALARLSAYPVGMTTLSGLVAALLAAAAPPHTTQPSFVVTDPRFRIEHVRVLRQPDHRTRTCTLRGQNAQTGRVERAMQPVACEQPPRSKVILTFSGGLFGNGR